MMLHKGDYLEFIGVDDPKNIRKIYFLNNDGDRINFEIEEDYSEIQSVQFVKIIDPVIVSEVEIHE